MKKRCSERLKWENRQGRPVGGPGKVSCFPKGGRKAGKLCKEDGFAYGHFIVQHLIKTSNRKPLK